MIRLLASLVLAVTLLQLPIAFAQTCQAGCTDYHRACRCLNDAQFLQEYTTMAQNGDLDEMKLKPVLEPLTPDCNTDLWKILCPESCNVCTSCVATSDKLDPLYQQLDVHESSLATLTTDVQTQKAAAAELERKADEMQAWVDSQEATADLDSNSYRLAVRHTSNQLTGGEFEALYRYGALTGAYINDGGRDQFRDPNFHFHWHDTTSVLLDIFNTEGIIHRSVFFQVPAHSTSSRTSFAGIFENNCQFVRDSAQNTDYTDIKQKCQKSAFNDNRRLYLAQDPNNDCNAAWFLLQNGVNNKRCGWEATLRRAPTLNNDNTVAFYDALPTVASPEAGFAVAPKIEFRISGAYTATSSETNGFEKVFRYPSYAGVHVLSYFEEGITDPNQDKSALAVPRAKTENMYRSGDMEAKLQGASEVMMVIYSMESDVVDALVYQGTGDMKSWLAENNLMSTVSWDIQGGFNFYSVDGHTDVGRVFYINNFYSGCPNDQGYFGLICGKSDGNVPCAGWEDIPDGYLCKIMYSTTIGKSVWNDGNRFAIGSAFELYVRSA